MPRPLGTFRGEREHFGLRCINKINNARKMLCLIAFIGEHEPHQMKDVAGAGPRVPETQRRSRRRGRLTSGPAQKAAGARAWPALRGAGSGGGCGGRLIAARQTAERHDAAPSPPSQPLIPQRHLPVKRFVLRPKIYARCDLWRASYSVGLIRGGYEEVFRLTARQQPPPLYVSLLTDHLPFLVRLICP